MSEELPAWTRGPDSFPRGSLDGKGLKAGSVCGRFGVMGQAMKLGAEGWAVCGTEGELVS